MKIKGFILLLLLSIAMCKVAVAQEPFLPFYWLEGRVIKPQDAPSDVSIANRLVIFYYSNEVEEDKYIFTWTNNEGRFHLNVFDLYYRYGRKIDFQDFSNYKVEIPRGSDGWGSDPVSVSWEVDKGYTSIEVTLKRGGRLLPGAISVKVRNKAGSSLPGVKILVNIEEKGSTNDNGELLISKVPPGGYDVRAIKDGYGVEYQRVSVYSAQTTNVDFTLSPLPNGYGVLCGYVTDEAGNFLSGVKIVLVSETGQQSYEALSDGGWFQLEVPEGNYTLTASLGGYRDFRADLTISAKEVRRYDILLRSLEGDRGTIEGRVRDVNTGGGISGAKVTDGIREVDTSKEGEFQIVVPYGTYIFRVLANGYLPTSEEITVNNPSVSKDFFLRKLDPGKSCICGYVRDTSGKSIVEASVSIGVSSVLTTWEGWYEFDNIDPGHYSITVRKESYKSQTKEIDLLSGEVREVNFILERLPDGVVDLNISWEGDDIVVSWDGATPDIYYLTGNGSGEFNNNYVENNWKKVSPEANVFSIDAGRKLLRHYGQIGGGSIEVYYKGLKAGVSPEVFIPLAPAVGKVCLNINRAESSGWNFFSYPFEDRDVNIGLIGNFNPNDEIWVWDEGMKNFTQVIKYQGSRWGQFILQRGVGHTLYRSDPNTLVATIIGKVDLKRKIISITRREATGWNFIGLPFPTQRTFEATDANENDEIWVWDNQAKGFIDRKKKSDWSKLQWLLDKDRYYLYYRSVPEYFNWEIESR